ncbi:hypothetical protein D3877_08690 [Azospirillum cavernae]|uniref:Transposase IS4-like domain-containing protein n=1 Tax=Azospirillum cavernae TaxID=2320860 RepID=A0A418W3M9_9PROT|nr:hypothetical protein D3877_08690 [Azospirillum cavernae]
MPEDPARSISATIASFWSTLQRRRRSGPGKISAFDTDPVISALVRGGSQKHPRQDSEPRCLQGGPRRIDTDLISLCQEQNWDYRLRLKGNLVVRDGAERHTTGELAAARVFTLENVQLTAKKATTNIGIIHDPDHDEPWIVAIPSVPGYLKTLDYSNRWAIEPMFSDFKSRGFGVEDTQIQRPDRLARLLLVMTLALYTAVSTGQWDTETNPTPAEKKT